MGYQELAVRLVLLAMKHRDVKEYTESNLDHDAQLAGNAVVAAALEFLGKHKIVTDVQPVFSSNGAAFAYKLSSASDDFLIDWVCGRFEEAWKESLLDDDMREASPELCDSDPSRPAIENYLGEIPEPGRTQLLRGLLSAELELRAEQGDAPSLEEYLDRYSADRGTVALAWQAFSETKSESAEAVPALSKSVSSRSPFAAPSAAELSAKLWHLKDIEWIGQGGMGAVYKAHDGLRFVAVKVLPLEVSDDAEFARRFEREAKFLASLDHPQIVRIYHFEKRDRLFFFTMEYAEKGNLRQFVKKAGISPGNAINITLQVCEGLQFAHLQGVIHRDIKPENILVDREGRVKIADFGLAKHFDPNRPTAVLTKTNQFMGTPDYMAPEQKRSLHIDHRADIYSLGVVLYELLTGDRPMGAFDLPSQKNPNSPEWLDEIVRCCLRERRDDRFNNVGEIINSIGQRQHERVRHIGTAWSSFPDEYSEILREGPPPEKLSTFLKGYPSVLGTALGGYFIPPSLVDREHPFSFRADNLGGFRPHLSVGIMVSTAPHYEWRHFLFCPSQGQLFDNRNPIDELAHAIENLAELDAWNRTLARQGRAFVSEGAGGSHHEGIILAGRRKQLPDEQRECIERLRSQGILIRSYDWLLDAWAAIRR